MLYKADREKMIETVQSLFDALESRGAAISNYKETYNGINEALSDTRDRINRTRAENAATLAEMESQLSMTAHKTGEMAFCAGLYAKIAEKRARMQEIESTMEGVHPSVAALLEPEREKLKNEIEALQGRIDSENEKPAASAMLIARQLDAAREQAARLNVPTEEETEHFEELLNVGNAQAACVCTNNKKADMAFTALDDLTNDYRRRFAIETFGYQRTFEDERRAFRFLQEGE